MPLRVIQSGSRSLFFWLVIVLTQTLHIQATGEIRDNNGIRSSYSFGDSSSEEDETSREETRTTTNRSVVSTEASLPYNPWMELSTAKIVTLMLISFTIPLGFMILLFWRLQKEKKYMSRAGALIYRETVLVPSYNVSTSENASQQPSPTTDNFNVVQMHSTLYDTPPDYDEVARNSHFSVETEKTKYARTEDIPPPSYSTVYM